MPCGSREAKPRFTPEDLECFRRWEMCRDLGIPPKPGSLAEQDPWEMERFRILFHHERLAREKTAGGMLAALFARRAF